ncbi:hypothetical protein CN204_30105 [Sinorhizobium meliloti]|uniref:Rap1a/Tai family immunity protein n=1 Tax=Rhizobium meliloti TaxID=382 RepID=UPI000FD91BE0|nr:Rap1a/Tai family immunity protein [Sinorhizobium meliloti]MDX1112932.1 hypothetical protein [Sinorhizobium medicae]MDW9638488.1 hypothetical protein [Sinorhizobium meliloti]MDX0283605.1 hypothetical protein [Sinorhizobium meliloti]RVH78045.1 hypothetical protein CN204_30105 [Sinorhizobium meliloti]RVK71628.1 hypothetical protein CN154_23210 [Sinorhizobium meliloti]
MRKTHIGLATTIILTLGLTEAHAIDGKLLSDWCRSDDPELLTYVSGVVDTLLEGEGTDLQACLPGSTSRMEIVEQTCRWLKESPENRHQGGAKVVFGALEFAYPCN